MKQSIMKQIKLMPWEDHECSFCSEEATHHDIVGNVYRCKEHLSNMEVAPPPRTSSDDYRKASRGY